MAEDIRSSSINEAPDLMKVIGCMLVKHFYDSLFTCNFIKTLIEENDALKAILQGATLTVTIGESHKKQVSVTL